MTAGAISLSQNYNKMLFDLSFHCNGHVKLTEENTQLTDCNHRQLQGGPPTPPEPSARLSQSALKDGVL